MEKVRAKVEAKASWRYWEIADLLRKDIESGKYRVGARLPTEEQLLGHFGSSRYCIREALRVLTENGLIFRRPRAGSTVIAAAPPSHFTQQLSSVQELLNYPTQTIRKTISAAFVVADHDLCAALKCPVGSQWFRIRALRHAIGSSVPLCQTDIYIAPEFAGVTRHKKHESIPVADQIAEIYGETPDSTEIEISASLVSEPVARLLQVPAGSPALTVVRRYASADGKVFEIAVGIHPAQRYTYVFQLKRERPPARKRAVRVSA